MDRSFDELEKELEGLTVSTLRKFFPGGYLETKRGILHFDDLLQEARLALLEAMGRYDDQKKMSFSSYFFLVLRSACLNLYLSRQVGDEEILKKVQVSPFVDDPSRELERKRDTTDWLYAERKTLPRIRGKHTELSLTELEYVAMQALSEFEQKVFWLRYDGYTLEETAQRLSYSGDVSRIILAIRKKLAAYLSKTHPGLKLKRGICAV